MCAFELNNLNLYLFSLNYFVTTVFLWQRASKRLPKYCRLSFCLVVQEKFFKEVFCLRVSVSFSDG